MPYGKICNVNRCGTGELCDQEGNKKEFSYFVIRGGYRGELPTRMKQFGPDGLVEGCEVFFILDEEGEVESVEGLYLRTNC